MSHKSINQKIIPSLIQIVPIFISTFLSAPTQAALVDINFSTNLSFDINQQVAAGGVTTGDILTNLYGPGIGSGGNLPVTGTVTYDSNTPVFRQTQQFPGGGIAAYKKLVTSVELNVAGTDIQADIPLLNNNEASGFLIGANSGGHCIAGGCPAPGVFTSRASNAAIVGNNIRFRIIGPNGQEQFINRDIFTLALGGVNDEFTPSFATSIAGDLSIGGLLIDFIGFQNQNAPFTDDSLPSDNMFLDPSLIENTVIRLIFSGDEISSFTGTGVSQVPIPAAFWLFGSAIVGLFRISKYS